MQDEKHIFYIHRYSMAFRIHLTVRLSWDIVERPRLDLKVSMARRILIQLRGSLEVTLDRKRGAMGSEHSSIILFKYVHEYFYVYSY